jgi:hypothetical protein
MASPSGPVIPTRYVAEFNPEIDQSAEECRSLEHCESQCHHIFEANTNDKIILGKAIIKLIRELEKNFPEGYRWKEHPSFLSMN